MYNRLLLTSRLSYVLEGGIEVVENVTILMAPYESEDDEGFQIVAFFNGYTEKVECEK